jgi:hypothetical protein
MSRRDRGDPGLGSGVPSRYPGTFLLAFREAVAALDWKVRRWLGDAVECTDAAGDEHTLGLENLYRRARRVERTRWPELIRDFLSKVREAEDACDPDVELAAVADHLMVRLGQPFTSAPNTMRVWAQAIPGTPLSINLVIDHAETMSYVTEEMVERSGRTGDDWLEKAMDNLLERTPEDCLQLAHEQARILLCNVADAYDSSRALLLDDLLPGREDFGFLIALPGRDELFVLPITTQGMPFAHLLKVIAEKNFRTAPYPITDQVFWIREGVWTHLPIELRGNTAVLDPPPEFAALFEELEAAEEEDEEDPKENDEGEP